MLSCSVSSVDISIFYGAHPFIFFVCTQIGVSSGAKTVFLPADDKSMQSMFRDGILEGNAAA